MTNINQCPGTFEGGKCGGPDERKCCVPLDCSLAVYENTDNVKGPYYKYKYSAYN